MDTFGIVMLTLVAFGGYFIGRWSTQGSSWESAAKSLNESCNRWRECAAGWEKVANDWREKVENEDSVH